MPKGIGYGINKAKSKANSKALSSIGRGMRAVSGTTTRKAKGSGIPAVPGVKGSVKRGSVVPRGIATARAAVAKKTRRVR